MLTGLVYIISASPTPTVPLNDFVKAFTIGKECWHCVDGVFAPHYPLAIRWWPSPLLFTFQLPVPFSCTLIAYLSSIKAAEF